MNRWTQKLIRLLAVSGYSSNEIEAMLMESRKTNLGELLAYLSHVRALDEDVGTSHAFADRKAPSQVRIHFEQTQGQGTGARVSRLLREEAGLPTAQAMALLAERLVSEGLIEQSDVPPSSKKSFEDWVERLSRRVAPKDILRFATLIRNSRIHSPDTDWKI